MRKESWFPSRDRESNVTETRQGNSYDRRDQSGRNELIRRSDYGNRRETHKPEASYEQETERRGRPSARERLSFTRDSETASHRGNLSKSTSAAQRTEWRSVLEGSKSDTPGKSVHSQVSHTPSPRPQRETISSQAVSPQVAMHKSGDSSNLSNERRSSLERLSRPVERVPFQDGIANAASGRLQEVEIQYLEENLNIQASGGNTNPSSSKTPRSGSLMAQEGITDRSPIRSLSEDRVHVSLRLGPVYESAALRDFGSEETLSEDIPHLRRPTEKGKASVADSRKRVAKTTNQGVSVKKRRVTKGHNSPKRRTPPATPGAGQAKKTQGATSGAQPRTTVFPASKRKGTDFRSAPNPLP